MEEEGPMTADYWEEDELEMEDALDGGSAWELGFIQGAELANDEMIDRWEEEEDF